MSVDMNAVKEKAFAWYEANKAKSKATNEERKLTEELKVLAKDAKDPLVININNKESLLVGELQEDSVVIDPVEFFKKYPDEFWQLVTIPKGEASSLVGEKAVTKCSKAITTLKFKVKKQKI